jgi:RimJ/RimL family protein N-acetyltransferase
MIKTVEFNPAHIDALEGVLKPVYRGDPELLNRLRSSWNSFGNYIHTIMADEEVLAVVGGTQPWEGVLEVFTLLTTRIEKHGVSFARKIKKILDFYFKTLKLHRMQAYARAGFADASRFLRFLGFELEAHHRMFGPEKADYFMFARFK